MNFFFPIYSSEILPIVECQLKLSISFVAGFLATKVQRDPEVQRLEFHFEGLAIAADALQ